MQTANAIKVGIWIVIAVVILIFGTRFFQGLALGGSQTVFAKFERVDGLIAGNSVQMRGVRVGNVRNLSVDEDAGVVIVRMSINKDVIVREGSVAHLSGIASIGDMSIEVEPGPRGNPRVTDGDTIAAASPINLVAEAKEAAGGYMTTIDSILHRTDAAVAEIQGSVGDGGDIRSTLESVRDMSQTLDGLLSAEAAHLSNTIRNFESLSANLDTLTATEGDSTVVANLQRSLDQLDVTLRQTESLTANLDSILMKMNAGQGTLGLLANDPSLYRNLDSVAVNLSRLLEDLRRDPKRYLSHVKAVDIF